MNDPVAIRKAITAGFFYHTAKLQRSGNYRTIKHKQSVAVHPSSSLKDNLPKWVVYFELVFTTREFMRSVIAIDPEWLIEIAPHYYRPKDVLDDSKKALPKSVGRATMST